MVSIYIPLAMWCVLLPTCVVIFSLVYLIVRRSKTLSQLEGTSPGNGAESDGLTPDHSTFYRALNDHGGDQTILKTIARTYKDSSRQTSKVVRPAIYASTISAVLVAVGALLFVCMGRGTGWGGFWAIPVAAILGSIASLASFFLYLSFSPVVGVQAILACRDATSGLYASETLSDTADCFLRAQRAALSGNTALALVAGGMFLLVDFLATLMSDLLLPANDYWGSALYVFAASAGAHICTLVLSSVGSSFSEGIFISLYKLEAATQHRVDGTLRITANTVQSAVGAQLVICGTILDLHGLSLTLLAATTGEHPFMRYATTVAVCGAIAMAPLFVLANFTVYDGREVVRRARLSIALLCLSSAGAAVAAIASLSPPTTISYQFEPPVKIGYAYMCVAVAGVVIALITLSVELFTSKLTPLAALHCDIGSASSQNSVVSSASIFGFVAIAIFAVALNTLVWEFGFVGGVFFSVGMVAPVVTFGAVFANFRGVISSALCYSRTAQMSAVVQDVLESMTSRSDTLESYSHIASAFTGPIILLNIVESFFPFYSGNGRVYIPNARAVSQMALVGLALAMLTEGFITFFIGRSTMRVCRAVEEAVKTGENRRRLSSMDSTNRDDDGDEDPLKGDYVCGVTAVFLYLALLVVVLVVTWFISEDVYVLLCAAMLYIFFECVRGSAVACLGSAVKNYVVQGGLSNQESAYADVQFAAVQAAASTTPRAAANVISLTLWRLVIVTVMIMVPTLRTFQSEILL